VTPQTLGRYQIAGELGRGSMSVVYRALDTTLGREAAIKVPHADGATSETRERFLREARSAARLAHPGIVTTYDVGEEGGVAYLAMELLEGRSLRQKLRDNAKLPLHTVADVAAQVAQALDHAQRLQIVHRGVRPANVMVSADGRVKLTDFGVACSPSPARTLNGAALEWLRYMSPEQALGLAVDPRSDIFSLGVTLYELLVKRTPFERAGEQNALAFVTRIARDAHRPVREIDAQIPQEMDRILARALAKKPDERYARADEMANDLRALGASLDGAARGIRQATPANAPAPVTGVDLSGLVGDLDAFARNFDSDRHARMQEEQAERRHKEEALRAPSELPELDLARFVAEGTQPAENGPAAAPAAPEADDGRAMRMFRRPAAQYFDQAATGGVTQTALLDRRLRAAYRYFADLATEAKSAQPVLPHPYEIAHFGDVAGLQVTQAIAESRPRKIEAQEVLDQVVLRYEMQAARPVTAELSPFDLPEFRRKLEMAQFGYKLDEKKNELGKLTRATASLAVVSCWVTLHGEYNDGTIDIELKNVRRLGFARTRIMVDGFTGEALDKLMRYVFGLNDEFAGLLKSSWT
jgi:serine/threonine-protein kinase